MICFGYCIVLHLMAKCFKFLGFSIRGGKPEVGYHSFFLLLFLCTEPEDKLIRSIYGWSSSNSFTSFISQYPIVSHILSLLYERFHISWPICSSCPPSWLQTLTFDIYWMIRECRPPAAWPTVHHSTFESTRSCLKFQFHPFVSASHPSLSCLRAFIQVSSATSSWLSYRCFAERLHHGHLSTVAFQVFNFLVKANSVLPAVDGSNRNV